MNENIQFLQAFLKNPGKGRLDQRRVSSELARRMVAGIKPDENNVVLELGVGTGAITKFLQEIVPDENSYLGIELDRDLVRIAQEKLSGHEDHPRQRLRGGGDPPNDPVLEK